VRPPFPFVCYATFMQPYVVLEKKVGETPLQCAEAWRATQSPALKDIPLAYAGRLDPMASGKLLILIGDECKRQTNYHSLNKAYDFSVLLGVASDTADVLGIVTATKPSNIPQSELRAVARDMVGDIELPYPHYSSKTVQGKPLHTWTLEGRLGEIIIPTKQSTIYNLSIQQLETMTTQDIYTKALLKIDSLPPVTDSRKSLGNDFRRVDVKASWETFLDTHPDTTWQIAHFHAIATSGTYMRTLAEVIANRLGTTGLAWSIHRTAIGQYRPLPFTLGYWSRRYQ